MSSEFTQAEQRFLAELDQVRQKAGDLAQQLREIDHELDGMAEQRRQYQLLEQVCASLDELETQGAAGLFWEGLADASGSGHIGRVRARMGEFHRQLMQIEERRREVSAALEQEHDNMEALEEEILEARAQEERRKEEWVIEREISEVPHRPSPLPGTRGGEDDLRFRRSLAATATVALLLGIALPQIELPLPTRTEVIEVPERFARLIREQEQTPPTPVLEEPEPLVQEDEPETTPEPEPVEEPEPAPRESDPAVAEEPPAREPAEPTGILAFRERFSGRAESQPSRALGAQARISSAGESAAERSERSIVATERADRSGGIDVGALSRDVGGSSDNDIGGVEAERIASAIGTEGAIERPAAEGPGPGRTDEEIQIVFDRYKAALYRLYNRELRRDPTLRGQMVLRLTIEPDGSVSLAEVQSTELAAPELMDQIVERVESFDFGEKDVAPVTILYPIDFLPAA